MNTKRATYESADAFRHTLPVLDQNRRTRWGALIARIANGDIEACGTLYDESSCLAFSLIVHILQDRKLAEDALVDMFVQVRTKARTRGHRVADPVAWLIDLARSAALARLPQGRRSPSEALSSSLGPARSVLAFEPFHRDRQQVSRALEQLTPRQRFIIQMIYFGGFTVQAAASVLHIPVADATAETRCAVQAVRNALEG